ncbi:MAG: rane protein [Frankiales bacterium]|nr:rane protein [Frankiales bacterium]
MSSSTQSERGHAVYTPTETKYLEAQQSAEFQDLRRRYRGWCIPVALAALAWYFLYVLLSAYAVDFMSNKLVGNINVGLVLGLLQFVSVFGVTALYISYANRVLDPVSTRIRDEFEAGR